MVINIGELKDGNDEKVQKDIEAVVAAAKDKALVKVIIETSLLNNEEKVKACELAKAAGADFVKTSTVGPEMGVKASGGIHNAKEAAAMIEAGATRLGASSGVAIMNGLSGTGY